MADLVSKVLNDSPWPALAEMNRSPLIELLAAAEVKEPVDEPYPPLLLWYSEDNELTLRLPPVILSKSDDDAEHSMVLMLSCNSMVHI
jgi:hypothetical protein